MPARWEYRSRVVKMGRSDLEGDQALIVAARPDEGAFDAEWWEVFSVQPLGGDEYRLFLRRPNRDR